MPQGKGTYGSQVGRPKIKMSDYAKKALKKDTRTARDKAIKPKSKAVSKLMGKLRQGKADPHKGRDLSVLGTTSALLALARKLKPGKGAGKKAGKMKRKKLRGGGIVRRGMGMAK